MDTSSHSGRGFGKYRLIAELGHGGMASVYLAATGGPGGFNKLSVLKLLRDLQESEGVEMFLEEARLAAQLNHPNVVQTHEVGKVGQQYFIAMEFIDGPALNRLRRRVKMPLPVALHVVSCVLEGLRYTHALQAFDGRPLGLVHRDLSPQNVLVTYEGDCKIVDFGIAKVLGSELVTREGLFKGKLTYMPPEQLRGQAVDQRTDLFAVGALLYELLSGQRLWQGESELVVVQRLGMGDVPRLRPDLPEVGPELADLCNWALEPHPDARCPSAAVLQAELDRLVRQRGQAAGRRELGALVASAFSADREKLRRLVAAQLEGLREDPGAGLQARPVPRASYGSSSSSGDLVGEDRASSGLPPERVATRSGVRPSGVLPDAGGPSAPGPERATQPGRRWWVAAVAVAAVALGVMGLLAASSSSAGTAHPPEPGPGAALPAAPAKVEAPPAASAEPRAPDAVPSPPPSIEAPQAGAASPAAEAAARPVPPPAAPAPPPRAAKRPPRPVATPRDETPPDELGF